MQDLGAISGLRIFIKERFRWKYGDSYSLMVYKYKFKKQFLLLAL